MLHSPAYTGLDDEQLCYVSADSAVTAFSKFSRHCLEIQPSLSANSTAGVSLKRVVSYSSTPIGGVVGSRLWAGKEAVLELRQQNLLNVDSGPGLLPLQAP